MSDRLFEAIRQADPCRHTPTWIDTAEGDRAWRALTDRVNPAEYTAGKSQSRTALRVISVIGGIATIALLATIALRPPHSDTTQQQSAAPASESALVTPEDRSGVPATAAFPTRPVTADVPDSSAATEVLQSSFEDISVPTDIDLTEPISVVSISDHQLFVWTQTGSYLLDVASGRWFPTAPAPIKERQEAAVLWTGERLFIWGGYDTDPGLKLEFTTYSAEGVLYDPATDSWSTIAPSPLEPRTPAVAAWTGREVMLFGGWRYDVPGLSQAEQTAGIPGRRRLQDAAAYDPSSNTWRTVKSFDASNRFEQIQISSSPSIGVWAATPDASVPGWSLSNRLYTFDESDDTWNEQPKSQLLGWSPAGDWVADTFVALGQTHLDDSADVVGLEAAVWTTRDGWTSIAPPDLNPALICSSQVLDVDGVAVVQRCNDLGAWSGDQWYPLVSTRSGTELIAVGPWILEIGDSIARRLLVVA